MKYLSDESCLYNYTKADPCEKAGAFLLHGGRVQKQASTWWAGTRIAAVILGNRVGCLFRELRENSSASLVSTSGANRGNLRGLVRFFLSVYLAHALVHRSICERIRLASLPRGSLCAFVCVAAYVWLRRDMATAREAKHINCRLTPQKQHDLIPRRICKRLSYTSKFHSKATSTTRKERDDRKKKRNRSGISFIGKRFYNYEYIDNKWYLIVTERLLVSTRENNSNSTLP